MLVYLTQAWELVHNSSGLCSVSAFLACHCFLWLSGCLKTKLYTQTWCFPNTENWNSRQWLNLMHSYLVVINSQVHTQLYITENYLDSIIWFPLYFADSLVTNCTIVRHLKLLQFFLNWPEYSYCILTDLNLDCLWGSKQSVFCSHSRKHL